MPGEKRPRKEEAAEVHPDAPNPKYPRITEEQMRVAQREFEAEFTEVRKAAQALEMAEREQRISYRSRFECVPGSITLDGEKLEENLYLFSEKSLIEPLSLSFTSGRNFFFSGSGSSVTQVKVTHSNLPIGTDYVAKSGFTSFDHPREDILEEGRVFQAVNKMPVFVHTKALSKKYGEYQYHLLMPFLRGVTLEDYFLSEIDLLKQDKLRIAIAIAEKVQWLNEVIHVRHNDLHSGNIHIEVNPNGSYEIYLLDFDIIRYWEEDLFDQFTLSALDLEELIDLIGREEFLSPKEFISRASQELIKETSLQEYALLPENIDYFAHSPLDTLKEQLPELASDREFDRIQYLCRESLKITERTFNPTRTENLSVTGLPGLWSRLEGQKPEFDPAKPTAPDLRN